MGQTNAKVEGRGIKLIGEKYSEYLGKIKIYKSDRERLSVGLKNNKFKIDLLQHTSLHHPNILSLLTYSSGTTEFLGINQENLLLYFDYVDVSLQDIINVRSKNHSYFSNDEIFRLIKDVLSGLSYLENTQTLGHYGISPKSIFYDKQTKKMLIYDSECIFGKFKSYFDIKNRQKSLISPEMINSLKMQYKNSHDPYYLIDENEAQVLTKYKSKIDVFCFGLTLLNVCTYISSENLFDYTKLQFNYNEIEKRIQLAVSLQEKNSFLNQILRAMLNQNPDQRPFASNLLKMLKQYQENPQNYYQNQQPQKKPTIQTNNNFQQNIANLNQQAMTKTPTRRTKSIVDPAVFLQKTPQNRQRSPSPNIQTMKQSAFIGTTRLPSKSIYEQQNPRQTSPQQRQRGLKLSQAKDSPSWGKSPISSQKQQNSSPQRPVQVSKTPISAKNYKKL